MKVTIKNELTWVGMNREFANQSEKKIKRTLKELTGADDVDVIDVNCWLEDNEEDNE